MGFEKEKDKQLFEKVVNCGMFNIIVSVYQYNEGIPKLQLSRQKLQEGKDPMFQKLGRMSWGEIDEILPAITEAMVVMKSETSFESEEDKEAQAS